MIDTQPSIDASGIPSPPDLARDKSLLKSGDYVCALPHIGYIHVTGGDAEVFLQAQLTNDIKRLGDDGFQLHGLCNPKGRLLCIFIVTRHPDGFLLQLPNSLVADILQYLQRYVLRAKVALSPGDEFAGLGVTGPGAAQNIEALVGRFATTPGAVSRNDDLMILAHPGAAPRFQVVAPSPVLHGLRAGISADLPVVGPWTWALSNIHAGIPTIYPATREAFVPQMVNMDLIDGINFNKGCYPGQEIVARMHYLGKLKQRMFRGHMQSVTASDNGPKPGDAVYLRDQTQAAGTVVDAQAAADTGRDLLMVLRLKGLEENTLHIAHPNGDLVELRDLPYPLTAYHASTTESQSSVLGAIDRSR